MGFQQHKGWRRLVNATGYSWAGLRAAWRNEEAFRQEAVLAVVLAPAAFVLGRTGLQQALLLGVLMLVLVVELLNSAIEAVVDRIGHDRHPLSGQAKDMGSAAVAVISSIQVSGSPEALAERYMVLNETMCAYSWARVGRL